MSASTFIVVLSRIILDSELQRIKLFVLSFYNRAMRGKASLVL